MHITNPTWKSTRVIIHWPCHHFTSTWCYILCRILIKVFFWYNSFNINKTCMISLSYKELLSSQFASSTSTPMILMKSEHKNACNYKYNFNKKLKLKNVTWCLDLLNIIINSEKCSVLKLLRAEVCACFIISGTPLSWFLNRQALRESTFLTLDNDVWNIKMLSYHFWV